MENIRIEIPRLFLKLDKEVGELRIIFTILLVRLSDVTLKVDTVFVDMFQNTCFL